MCRFVQYVYTNIPWEDKSLDTILLFYSGSSRTFCQVIFDISLTAVTTLEPRLNVIFHTQKRLILRKLKCNWKLDVENINLRTQLLMKCWLSALHRRHTIQVHQLFSMSRYIKRWLRWAHPLCQLPDSPPGQDGTWPHFDAEMPRYPMRSLTSAVSIASVYVRDDTGLTTEDGVFNIKYTWW